MSEATKQDGQDLGQDPGQDHGQDPGQDPGQDDGQQHGRGEQQQEMFTDINSDAEPIEMESLCLNCYEQGKTRLLLTRIPYFKDIVIMAFSCPHCHYSNNDVQSAGAIGDRGVTLHLSVNSKSDLNRQVVKSEWASLSIPSLEFQSPPAKQSRLNTVEGLLRQIASNLADHIQLLLVEQAETAAKISAFLVRLNALADGDDDSLPFTFVLDDPSGNSFIENPYAPKPDSNLQVVHYVRNDEQNAIVGIQEQEKEEKEQEGGKEEEEEEEQEQEEEQEEEKEEEKEEEIEKEIEKEVEQKQDEEDEIEPEDGTDDKDTKGKVLSIPSSCSACAKPGRVRMFVLDIPYFKEIVLMAFTCKFCGHKSTEVKSSSAISPQGKRLTLKVTSPEDLNRDILKSETCGIEIPELEFSAERGVGGMFTTVEGIMDQLMKSFQSNPFMSLSSGSGDSKVSDTRQKLNQFLTDFEQLMSGNVEFHLILDDPMGNSYIQNIYAPDPDPNLTIEDYERTWEQNEALGLNDINTADFETLPETESAETSAPSTDKMTSSQ